MMLLLCWSVGKKAIVKFSAWEEKCAGFMAFDGAAVSALDLRRRLGAGRMEDWSPGIEGSCCGRQPPCFPASCFPAFHRAGPHLFQTR